MPLVLAGTIAAGQDLAPGTEKHQRLCAAMTPAPADLTLCQEALEGARLRRPGLFGHAACPRCRTQFRVSDAIADPPGH